MDKAEAPQSPGVETVDKSEMPRREADQILSQHIQRILHPSRFLDELQREAVTELAKIVGTAITIGGVQINISEVKLPDGYLQATIVESGGKIFPAFLLPPDVNSRLKKGDQQLHIPTPDKTLSWATGFKQLIDTIPVDQKGIVGTTPFDANNITLVPSVQPDGSQTFQFSFLRLYPKT